MQLKIRERISGILGFGGNFPRRRSRLLLSNIELLDQRIVLASPQDPVVAEFSSSETSAMRAVPPEFIEIDTSAISKIDEGASASLTIKLLVQPTRNVGVSLSMVSDARQARVKNSTLTFTTQNWTQPQTITIEGVENDGYDGDQVVDLNLNFVSLDSRFDEISESLHTTIVDTGGDSLTGMLTGNITYSGDPDPSDAEIQKPLYLTLDGTEFDLPHNRVTEASLVGDQISFTLHDIAYEIESARFTGTLVHEVGGDRSISGTWTGTGRGGYYSSSGQWSVTTAQSTTVWFGLGGTITLEEGEETFLPVSLSRAPISNVEVSFRHEDLSEPRISFDSASDVHMLVFTPENWSTPQNLRIHAINNNGSNAQAVDQIKAYARSTDRRFNIDYAGGFLANVLEVIIVDPALNGNYSGSALGSLTTPDGTTSVDNSISLSISGNVINNTTPVALTGSNTRHTVSFTQTDGPLAGAVYHGEVFRNSDETTVIQGSWTLSRSDIQGSGTFSVDIEPITPPNIAENWFTDHAYGFTHARIDVEFNHREPYLIAGTISNGFTVPASHYSVTLKSTRQQPNVFQGEDGVGGFFDFVFSENVLNPRTAFVTHRKGAYIESFELESVRNSTLIINPSLSLSASPGGSNEVSLSLSAPPISNVDLDLVVIQGQTLAELSKSHLTFTPVNWNVPQVMTIAVASEVGGLPPEGLFVFEVSATSDDTDYQDLLPKSVTVSISGRADGVYSGRMSGTVVTEGDFFHPPMNESFSHNITFLLNSADIHILDVSPGEYFPVSASSGSRTENAIAFSIENLNASSLIGGEKYDFTGVLVSNPNGTKTASGTWVLRSSYEVASGSGTWSATAGPGLRITDSGENIQISEGRVKTIPFALTYKPISNVEVVFSPIEGAGQALLSGNSLTFTPDNWNTPQSLAITGVMDGNDGNQPFVLSADFTSSDPVYDFASAQLFPMVVRPLLDGNYSGRLIGETRGFDRAGSTTSRTPFDRPFSFSVLNGAVTINGSNREIDANGHFRMTVGTFAALYVGDFVVHADGSVTASGTFSESHYFSSYSESGNWTVTRN